MRAGITRQLCRQMVDYILPLATPRDQTLTYEAAETDVTINGDLHRLKQLLLNLLDNAIKYTDHHGSVTLALKSTPREAIIEVRDTGRGIPKEDVPHIFERFFRRSRSTSDRSASGFGLGLSIVKWIVDSHGGKIRALSEVEEVELPGGLHAHRRAGGGGSAELDRLGELERRRGELPGIQGVLDLVVATVLLVVIAVMSASIVTAVTVVPSTTSVPVISGVRPTAVVDPIADNSSSTLNPTNVPVESS